MPDDGTPKTNRKRKNSPKASASQRKRPRAIHSATQPLPASKHFTPGSSSKTKGKQRQRSLDRSESDSPDFAAVDSLALITSVVLRGRLPLTLLLHWRHRKQTPQRKGRKWLGCHFWEVMQTSLCQSTETEYVVPLDSSTKFRFLTNFVRTY